MKLASTLTVCLLFGMSIPAVYAAAAPKTHSPASARHACQDASQGTVVVYPLIFDKSGTKTSHAAAVAAMRDVLQTAGYTLISETVTQHVWQAHDFAMPTQVYPVHVDDLVRFGKIVHADYVVSAKFHFHSRSIWVDWGPKTVSTVTTDLIIVDVNRNKLAYSKLGVEGRSDTRGKVIDLFPLMFLNPPIESMVSGGPKTPHEQRAADIAVATALKDWVKPVQISQNPARP